MEFAYLSYAENAKGLRTTDCPDVTDRLFDKRKEANVFRKQVRSGPCFLRGLLSEENPYGALGSRALLLPSEPPPYPCDLSRRSFGVGGSGGALYFGPNEATIFSKRGSPRSGSQKGSSFN